MARVYYLIGDAGSDQYPRYWDNVSAIDQDLRFCMYFLIDRYGPPPPGSDVEIITATYYSDFRTIALGFDDENEPAGAYDYAQKLEMAMHELVKSVDWVRIQPNAIDSVIRWKQQNRASLGGKPRGQESEAKASK